MEPSKEPIAVRITRLNRQILGKANGAANKLKKTIDREALLDALTVLYDECNDDPVKKCDELVKAFVDKYRSTLAELRRTRVCISDFEIIQTIGRGHFGEVHMVKEKQTGDVYALKTVKKEAARRREVGTPEDERDVLAVARSPWIPKLQYAFQDNNTLYLVMELCNGGDLAGLLSRRNNPLSERDAAFYVAEVAHALKTLHGMGYVHRDVKPHNILLDRCGHVKLGDFGSVSRLSEGGTCGSAVPVGTPDYVSPELLAAAECGARHTVCLQYCQQRGLSPTAAAISACDYWSLGVVAFEMVTLKRPFSSEDEDSIAHILSNIQKYERDPDSCPPFDPPPYGPSDEWRSLVAGLLRVQPSRRYNYLDTLQHAALAHVNAHSIREQAPPWVPCTRGLEDASHWAAPPRPPPRPSAAPFRARPPFAGQLPFVGFTYVASEEIEDSTHSSGFNASHDCTAIDMATFKSTEKLAAMRGREITSLQQKLAAAEAGAAAASERARAEARAESDRLRDSLQAEITALMTHNKRLERQIELEKEERQVLEQKNQQLSALSSERQAEARSAQADAAAAKAECNALKAELRKLEAKVAELQADCARAKQTADTAKMQQQHYKGIIEHAQELRHRRLTEINVRAIDTIAKERALRRQTLSGGEAECREAGARLAQAEANLARELRNRELAEKRVNALEAENASLRADLDSVRSDLANAEESAGEKQRSAATASEQVKDLHMLLAHERAQVTALMAQVQELQNLVEEAARREAALEEQAARTEARLHQRADEAQATAAAALQDDARHKEKVATLEALVRQLEREVTALEQRVCPACAAREDHSARREAVSDTESVADTAHSVHQAAQVSLLKEQLDRAENQLQTRADEIAALKQEARTANLARWRKEREFNELSMEAKSTARELKRVEERLATATEARKKAEQKASELQSEIATLKPQYERANKEVERLKEQLERLNKAYETAQAEVDRSRNDIRKLKSELQYSEKRRLHAEQQEELSSRERAQLRDELTHTRAENQDLVQNNKALQEACSLLEDQLTDLEKLTDINEIKNKELESETVRLRAEVEDCRSRLSEAEKQCAERAAAASLAAQRCDIATEQYSNAQQQLQIVTERLESRETRVIELEARTASLEGELSCANARVASLAQRVRDLQEETSALRTRAQDHHALAMRLQASLDEANEEIATLREASEAAAAWWRTRETKADATLRQQAKLIDFLQTKVEEANRKKCSLSNKLFGRSGRRAVASPPLRRTNRELREEIERLRFKLASSTFESGDSCPPTPTPKKNKSAVNGRNNGLTPRKLQSGDAPEDDKLQVVWSDGNREKMDGKLSDGVLLLTKGNKELRAHLISTNAKNLPYNEASRAFTVQLEGSNNSEAAVICPNVERRAELVTKMTPPASTGYQLVTLCTQESLPYAALYLGSDAVAVGCADGLHSLRGRVYVELECDESPPRAAPAPNCPAVTAVAAVCGRALIIVSGTLTQGNLLALGSTLRRATNLKPAVGVTRVRLPDSSPPHLVQVISGEQSEGACAAVGCGRRVFVLRFDAAATEFKVARSLTVDRPPSSFLLTPRALYIAGEKPLKINLPSGALEAFGMDDLIISAAAKRHSPPKAILLINDSPVEILLCYAECGVFVNEKGARTRNEEPKWSSAVKSWVFVKPFLYLVGEDRVTIIYINEEAYRAPPCTCDTHSVTSTASECYMPDVYNLKVKSPTLLGTAPNGIIIQTVDNGYNISIVEGMAAFKSIGNSLESLCSMSNKGSSSDLAQSMTDLARSSSDCEQYMTNEAGPQDESHESVELTTGFLKDIRFRAKQLRMKNRMEQQQVIKDILSRDISLKRASNGRKSPTSSEFNTDSEDTDRNGTTESSKKTADVCAEMFTRQVRFQ